MKLLIQQKYLNVFLFLVFHFSYSSDMFSQGNFPKDGVISRQVDFWRDIFSKYDEDTFLIYRKHHPKEIVKIIDFKEVSKKNNLSKKLHPRAQKKIIEQLLKQEFKNPNEIKQLRIQSGLKNQIESAYKKALKYLPFIENVFQMEHLPKELAKLCFVESMFHFSAESFKGAVGLWQLMPKTAKEYLTVNAYIDERRSPFKSSLAAAKILAKNHKDLHSWPLAITAYNHGLYGMKDATKTLNTTSLSSLIQAYEAKSFGYASKNFYAEFLAITETFTKFKIKAAHPIRPHWLEITTKISLDHLLKKTPLTLQTIKEYNPDLTPMGVKRFLRESLPKGYQLAIPGNFKERVLVSLRKTNSNINKKGALL